MTLLSEIKLKWYSEDVVLTENPRALIDFFLDSIGVTKRTASDIFEVLLISRSRGLALTSEEIKNEVINMRKKRSELGQFSGEVNESLSDRNVQVWLKFFKDIKLLECINNRYVFSGNKTPSEVFLQYTKPLIIDESVKSIEKILVEVEKRYGLK